MVVTGIVLHKKDNKIKKDRATMFREVLLVRWSVSFSATAASFSFINCSLLHYMIPGNLVQCARSYTPCGEDSPVRREANRGGGSNERGRLRQREVCGCVGERSML